MTHQTRFIPNESRMVLMVHMAFSAACWHDVVTKMRRRVTNVKFGSFRNLSVELV